jgi:hypothetical protein
MKCISFEEGEILGDQGTTTKFIIFSEDKLGDENYTTLKMY